MKRKIIVVGKKAQLGAEFMTKIISALKTSNLITDNSQVEFLTLDVLAKIPKMSVGFKTTTTLLVGLKWITSNDLVKRIDYENKTSIEHLIAHTEGDKGVFNNEANVKSFDTLEDIAKQDFSSEKIAA